MVAEALAPLVLVPVDSLSPVSVAVPASADPVSEANWAQGFVICWSVAVALKAVRLLESSGIVSLIELLFLFGYACKYWV